MFKNPVMSKGLENSQLVGMDKKFFLVEFWKRMNQQEYRGRYLKKYKFSLVNFIKNSYKKSEISHMVIRERKFREGKDYLHITDGNKKF